MNFYCANAAIDGGGNMVLISAHMCNTCLDDVRVTGVEKPDGFLPSIGRLEKYTKTGNSDFPVGMQLLFLGIKLVLEYGFLLVLMHPILKIGWFWSSYVSFMISLFVPEV